MKAKSRTRHEMLRQIDQLISGEFSYLAATRLLKEIVKRPDAAELIEEATKLDKDLVTLSHAYDRIAPSESSANRMIDAVRAADAVKSSNRRRGTRVDCLIDDLVSKVQGLRPPSSVSSAGGVVGKDQGGAPPLEGDAEEKAGASEKTSELDVVESPSTDPTQLSRPAPVDKKGRVRPEPGAGCLHMSDRRTRIVDLGTVGSIEDGHWTLSLRQGSIVEQGPCTLITSADGAGSIVLTDGGVLTFDHGLTIRWEPIS